MRGPHRLLAGAEQRSVEQPHVLDGRADDVAEPGGCGDEVAAGWHLNKDRLRALRIPPPGFKPLRETPKSLV
jgi:hypothetical protein